MNGTPVGILGLVCGDESDVLFGEGMNNINASSSTNSGGTNGVSTYMDINFASNLRNDSFCSTLEIAMQSSFATRTAWFMLKPFLLGRIPYNPDTPLTRSLLQQVYPRFKITPTNVHYKTMLFHCKGYDCKITVQKGVKISLMLRSNLQANGTFEALALLGRLDEPWAFIRHAIRNTMQNNPWINLLKVRLKLQS
uniref:Uncharacterized protein n=1 Tax=Eptatretus burgeri TaxID=7764 RepID=A0A8C4Q2R0_EPTBU